MRRVVVAGVALVALAVGACSGSNGKRTGAGTTVPQLEVEVVSSRPDMVTGGRALLAITGAGTGDTPEVRAGERILTVERLREWWRVRGIPPGDVTLEVRAGARSGSVAITSYPITGPVFSGPHLPLLACTTDEHGLGPATDADCSAPAKVDHLYLAADGALKPLADPKAVPADAKYPGRRSVIRRERGVINRAVYWITIPEEGWNGRLVYRFGGGCGTTYGQGGLLGTTVVAPTFLADGYAVATATFNTLQVQCNDVLSAETAMMVKSHFITTFGVPEHTIGEGASGGSIQQHLILQNYPGILDAAIAILPFPDAITTAPGVADCGLLDHYYGTPAGSQLTGEQRAAINGHATALTCVLWEHSFLEGIRPADGCHPKIPEADIYDPVANPKGLRCDLPDANVNQFGRDPKTGFANRPLDNVGVQYGLRALNDGAITVDQFLDLNEQIGGYDIDGNVVAAREVATEEVLRIAYAKGRVSQGGGDQKSVPTIELNVYADFAGDIHDRFRAFSLRDRLGSPNVVIWTRGGAINSVNDVIGNIVSGGGGIGDNAVAVVDRWLETGTMPAEAADNCPGANGTFISGNDLYERPGPCRDNYPVHGDPRTAAGAPRRNDILKCRLEAVGARDYRVRFTAAQLERLRRVFPEGVCDWTQPGVGQVPLEGTWLRY